MRITKYNVMLDENRKNILVAESTKNYPSLGNAKAAVFMTAKSYGVKFSDFSPRTDLAKSSGFPIT